MRCAVALIPLVLWFALASWCGGQSAARAEEGVLHEYVPGLDPREVKAALAAGSSSSAAGDVGKKPGPRSEAPVAEADEQPESSAAGGGAASENFRPDRLTSLEGGLDYYEAFTPAIAPFKRMMALDAVRLDVDGKTPVLGVRDVRRRDVKVEGGAPGDDRPRDRFVGRVSLDLRTEREQRLPSVSPDSRVLSIQSSPYVALRVERDGADNFFVRASARPPDGAIEVSFQTDAPRAYFGSAIPALPLRALAEDAPSLHASIKRRGLQFAAELGLTPKTDLKRALEVLTRHFRGFVESASPPENTGDLYLDLARGGKGLCRHRAYGFVVTAHALGIPARFVQNEAHSWVEVKLGESGWLRIDLGGAAHGLTAHNAHDRPNYLPAQPDTLPRPESYRQSYARAEVPRSPASAPATPDSASIAGRWLAEPDAAPSASRDPAVRRPSAGASDAAPEREPLHIALGDRRMSALRGGKQVLTGRIANAAEQGVAELRVEVWIARPKPRERMLLGVTTTDGDGYFRAVFGVPADLAVGDYRMLVVSPGDEAHQAAVSE
jgi:hypothetical protein